MNLDNRAKSRRHLQQLQKMAYSVRGYPPPSFSADELRSRGATNAEVLREGGTFEADLVQRVQQVGGDPAWARSYVKNLARADAQLSAYRNVDRVLSQYGDAPTPHVDPFQHAILKRAQAEIEALPQLFPQLSFAEALEQLRGRVIVSTLPTGQPDAISRTVPETDQLLIVFDPTFFEFLYCLSNDFAELIDPDKMRQEAMRYMATGQERPLSEAIRYAEHRSLNESFAPTLMTFLEKGTPPPPRPFDDRAFQLAEHLRSTALIFAVAHEYAHILLDHLKPDKVGLRSVHAGPQSADWQDELTADRLAFCVIDAALTGRRLVRAVHFMGTDFFFLCVMLLNLGLDVLCSGRSVGLTDMADPSRLTDSQLATSHPIPALRLAHLHYWEESKFLLNEYRGMEYHAAILTEVASQAWLGVRPGFLRMHAAGVKPAASWTGLDIFEHQ